MVVIVVCQSINIIFWFILRLIFMSGELEVEKWLMSIFGGGEVSLSETVHSLFHHDYFRCEIVRNFIHFGIQQYLCHHGRGLCHHGKPQWSPTRTSVLTTINPRPLTISIISKWYCCCIYSVVNIHFYDKILTSTNSFIVDGHQVEIWKLYGIAST